MNAYAGRFKPEARAQWKAQLIANRATALRLLESLAEPPAPAAGQPVLNRAGGQTPPPPQDFPALVAAQLAAHAGTKSQAVDKVIATDRAAYEAWLAAGGGML